jgi:hypothetical protein
MSSQAAMSLMCMVEFALWAAFAYLFWTRKLHRRFPAMSIYLALRLVSMPVLLLFLYGQTQHWFNDYSNLIYFLAYWAVYIVSAVLLFFICVEVFRSALSAFSGLQRLGTIAFRWAALVSAILSLSTLSFGHSRILIIHDVAYGLMRSVSIIELCLLAFLCLSMNTLRLSARSMTFGLALGFGLMSSSDFVLSSFWSSNASLTDAFQLVSESLILVSLGMWVAYAALPEPVRQPVLLPVNSALFRWNEIASALGHTGTQVAMTQPAGGFFQADAERSAEGVLVHKLKSSESES